MKTNLLSLLFVLLAFTATAQLQIDDISTTASTCENNGSITITASNGAEPYRYELIAPSEVTRTAQSSNTFTGLPAGDYTVQVTDNDGTMVDQTTTIEDQFNSPIITGISTVEESCPDSNDASATIEYTGGTATPLTFRIQSTDGAGVDISQEDNPTFTGLAPGEYTAKIVDQCEIEYNYSFTITDPFSNFTLAGPFSRKRDCDKYTARLSLRNAVHPVSYTVTTADNTTYFQGETTETGIKSYLYVGIEFPLAEGSKVTAVDACGREVESELRYEEFQFSDSQTPSGCNTTLSVLFNRTTSGSLLCEDITYCIKLSSEPDSAYTCQDTNTFSNLPDGDYSIKITDNCCGNEYIQEESITTEAARVATNFRSNSCLSGTATTVTYLYNFKEGVKLTYVGDPIPDYTAEEINGGETYSSNLQPGDELTFVPSSSATKSVKLANLPIGSYDFIAEDNCGNSVPHTIEVTENNISTYDLEVNSELQCPGQLSINIMLTSPNQFIGSSTSRFDIYDANNERADYITSVRAGVEYESVGLDPGTYTVKFRTPSGVGTAIYDACPQTVERTVTVEPYSIPNLEETEFYSCGTDGTVVINAKGVEPLTYSIRVKDSGDSFSTPQSEPIFTGLDSNNTYEVQVVDNCGQNGIKIITAEGRLDEPSVSIDTDCEGPDGVATKGTLTANKIFGANYEWVNLSDPNTVVGTERTLTVDPWVVGDVYRVTISIPGSNGSVCQTSSFDFEITTDQCAVVPITLIDFTGEAVGDVNKLYWATSSEIDHDRFDIQISTNSTDWMTIGSVDGTGDATSLTNYSFIDENPGNGLSYYRLASVSLYNEVDYSNIVAINRTEIGSSSFVKNPVQLGEVITVAFNHHDYEFANLYNASGQLVASVNANSQANTIVIPTTTLSKGVYILTLSNSESKVAENHKIVIQ